MNQKMLKKMVKRQTAKKRAVRQTAKRRTRQQADRFKEQVAQDIYETLKASSSAAKRGRNRGQYRLKEYDYDMFEYGDPLKGNGRAHSGGKAVKRDGKPPGRSIGGRKRTLPAPKNRKPGRGRVNGKMRARAREKR